MRYVRWGARLALATTLLAIPRLAGAHEDAHGESGREGITVQTVVAGGAAETAGVIAGDRFVELDGKTVGTLKELRSVLGSHFAGDTVPLVVERDGEMLELSLTFGDDREGIVSMGVALAVDEGAAHGEPAGPEKTGLGREECLAWVGATYRVEAMLEELDLDLGEDWEVIRTCAAGDVQRMSEPIPVGWCDNVFKIHCSGLDLLTEIGEAQIERCEVLLGDSLGRSIGQDPVWKSCGAQKVFDRYSINGEPSDEAACRAALDSCQEGR